MRTLVRSSLVAFVAFAALLAACAPTGPDRVVDGWPIGERIDCGTTDCETHLSVASAGLERRDRSPASIVESTLHRQGTYELENGEMYLAVCSGGQCPRVAVLTMSDGSIRAIGVGRTGISTELRVSDWGPALNWEPPAR